MARNLKKKTETLWTMESRKGGRVAVLNHLSTFLAVDKKYVFLSLVKIKIKIANLYSFTHTNKWKCQNPHEMREVLSPEIFF